MAKWVTTKLRLADGRIVSGKIYGQVGGDVFDIKYRKGNKFVSVQQSEGRGRGVFPIKSMTKTPFVDIEVYKPTKTLKSKGIRKPKKDFLKGILPF